MAESQGLQKDEFEVLIQKSFGGGESLNIRSVYSTEDEAQKSIDKLYAGVVKDRADSFANETMNYQLKANGVNRLIEEDEKTNTSIEAAAKEGKK